MNNVSFIILYDDDKRILMQHRNSDAPTSPNHWGFFGGGIKEKETSSQAVIREAYEELEIELENPRLFYEEYVNIKNKEHTNFYFIEKIKDKSKIVLHEGQEMKWIFPNEIEKLLAKSYVKKVMKIIENELQKI